MMPIDRCNSSNCAPVRGAIARVRLCAVALLLTAQAAAAAEPPAAVQPVPEASADELAAWRQGIRDRIREQLIVPPDVPGDARVELEVSLLPSGNAADISTRRTSGYPAFDSAARRAVRAATPLPVPTDLQAYERVRRFGAIFEPGSGVQIVDAQAPVPAGQSAASPAAPPAAERFACAAELGPAPAPDCSQSGSRNHLLTCFAQAVQRRAVRLVSVCGAVAYPLEARRNRWEGSVQVGVSFDRGGKLAGVAVAESSGQALLDQRALEIVQQAMVPPPPELYATPFAVRVPVVFRMQRPASTDARAPGPQTY
jgi:TonB family protein